MKVVPVTIGEIAWRQCYQLVLMNPLAHPTYYSTLFDSFRSLLTEEHITELDERIKEVESFISDELNPITLQEAEIRMFQNMDLLSGFEVRGQMITQLDIQNRLEQIRGWLRGLLFMYMPYIRFTQQLRVM